MASLFDDIPTGEGESTPTPKRTSLFEDIKISSSPNLSAISPSGPGTAYPTPDPNVPDPTEPRGILQRLYEGARAGFGESKVPEELTHFGPGPNYFSQPAAAAIGKAAELPGRVYGAATGAAAGFLSGLAERSLGPLYPGLKRAEADRLMREGPGVATALNMGLAEAGMGGARPPEPAGLPRPGSAIPPAALEGPGEIAARIGVPRGGPPAPEEMAANVAGGMRDVVQKYETTAAERPEGQMHASILEGLGSKISGEMYRTRPDMVVANRTPETVRALSYLNGGPSKFNIKNQIGPQMSASQRADILDVNLSGLKEIRDNLMMYRDKTKPESPGRPSPDRVAMEHLINVFDARLVKGVTDGLFSGDKDFLSKWRNAEKATADIKALFESKPAQDSVMAKIVDPKTDPGEIVNYLLGSSKIGMEKLPLRIWDEISKNLEGHPSLQQWRETMWQHALVNDQVKDLVTSKIGKKMYDAPTLELMRRYATSKEVEQRQLLPAIEGILAGHLLDKGARVLFYGTGFGKIAGPVMKKVGESLGRRARANQGAIIND